MCVPNMAGQEARQLMTKAYKSALTLQQQQQLLTELDNDNKLVYHVGLTPSKVNERCYLHYKLFYTHVYFMYLLLYF